MNALISIAAFLVAIAILIAVHEFGHFIVARLLGVKVLRFSIGFGRVLLARRGRSGTEYAISAIPLGGYVKLLDEREGEVAPADLPRAFNRQPVWRRAAILIAGPGFNILFAVVAYWVVFVVGIPGLKPVVGEVASGSPAARAGIVKHDTILAVDGRQTRTWQAVRLALLDGVVQERPLVLRVQGTGNTQRLATLTYSDSKALTRPGGLLPGLGLSAWLPPIPAIVDKVEPRSPAAQAGLRPGDHVVAAAGKPVSDWQAFTTIVRAHPDQRMEVTIERSGKKITVPVTPERKEANGETFGLIGAAARMPADYLKGLRAEMRFGPAQSVPAALGRTGEVTALTAVMLYRMAVGQASLSNLSGPIDIAHYAGAWAQAGIVPFLFFLALISISLGIINILPIPLLDGGQLFYLGIELVRRRPMSLRAEAIGQRVGLSLIVILLGFAIFNDLRRLIH